MKHDIAFLHTSPVHQPTFEKLVQEAAPGLRIAHVVREDLLADAQRGGAQDPVLAGRIRKAMHDAGATGAKVVVCTCSTIGGVAEAVESGEFKATRVDRAMADKAVTQGRPVLMAAALESTLAPTMELLKASAQHLGTNPGIKSIVARDAWAYFLAGDTAMYVEVIVDAIRRAGASSSVVVLAQASMAPAAQVLEKLGITALSSPRLGVEHAIALQKAQNAGV